MLRNFATLIIGLVLCATAGAQMPDLSGAKLIISDAMCRLGSEPVPCSLVEKQGTQYVVLRVDEGEGMEPIAVYRVRKGAHPPFDPSQDWNLIWTKDEDDKLET